VQEAEAARDSLAQQLQDERRECARLSDLVDDLRAELDVVTKTAKQQCDSLQHEVESKEEENLSLHQRMMQERARSAALEDKIRCCHPLIICAPHVCGGQADATELLSFCKHLAQLLARELECSGLTI
jgi:uncharacterized protein YhaN